MGVYVGQWKDNKRHGQGTMIWANGDKYAGQWKDSKMHGKGTMTQLNGRKYLGQWKDNKRHGKGIILYKKLKNKYCNGQVTYSSNLKDDKMYGQGEMTYTDGRKERFWATANGLGPNLLKPVNFPPKPPARKNETVTPTAKPKPDGRRHCTRYPEPSAPPMDGPRHCTRDPKPSAPPMDGPHHCTRDPKPSAPPMARGVAGLTAHWLSEPLFVSKAIETEIRNILQAKRERIQNSQIECPVCLEVLDLQDKDSLTWLPCNHGFHPGCIGDWFNQGIRECPICRAAC